MAQVTAVRLVDDLDGGHADESVEFTVDNKRYQMDLSEKNAAQLREMLAPFTAAARRSATRDPRTLHRRRPPRWRLHNYPHPTQHDRCPPDRRRRRNRGHPGMG